MTSTLSPQPFDAFLESLTSATYDEVRSLPGSEVESAAAFEEMRTYLQDLYGGVRAVASFVETDGQVIDCVPADRHPAVKRWSSETLSTTTPAAQPAPESYETTPPPLVSPSANEFSNALLTTRNQDGEEPGANYPPDTIPMYRTTLEQLSRFRNLAAFSTKDRPGDMAALAASAFPKRYATGEQDIHCLGGGSRVNVWKPFATPTFQSTFSQQWYVAGHDGTLMQTVECGWHIDATRYQGSMEPHLFVFSTRKNYDDGHNVYNLDGGVFKPVINPYVTPGAPLLVSQTDGTQVEYKMGFYLTAGAWWFFFEDQPVGSFPLAWFDNGPLASGATRIKFGGEVGTGLPLWPAMGSGRHASFGFRKSAYQRAAFVNPVSGGGLNATLSEAGSVTGTCYSVEITNHSPSEWGTHLFFGGPGSSSC
jgi:hypothetical protein